MDEYIKRDAFIAWLKRIPLKDLSDGLGLCRIIMEEDFKRAIRELPGEMIVDVATVVPGRWISDGDGYHWTYNCSIYAWKDGYPFNERHNYCPNCGARMDGDAERRNT